MGFAQEFTSFPRPSRPLLIALALLWGTFAFFTVCALLSKDSGISDSARVAELQSATLIQPKSETHDWPQWRGPNRDGLSTETDLLASWPTGGPRLLWQQSSGEGFSSVAVVKGRLYTMVQDGADEAIVCRDAQTGRELWRHRYPANFRNRFGNGPRATPTIAGELLFAVGATGIMTALNISGAEPTVIWTKDLLKEFGARNLEWGVAFSPLVEGDLVFITPGGPDGRSVAAARQAYWRRALASPRRCRGVWLTGLGSLRRAAASHLFHRSRPGGAYARQRQGAVALSLGNGFWRQHRHSYRHRRLCLHLVRLRQGVRR